MGGTGMVNLQAKRGTFADYREFSKELSRCHLHWNIKPTNRNEFRARVNRHEVGRVVLSEVEHDSILGSRRIRDVNMKDDCVIGLTMFVKGSMAFSQKGRELLVQSNELLLWDGAHPGNIRSWEAVGCKTILFPRSLVCQHIGNIDELTGQKIGLGSGIGLLFKSHIETLYHTFGLISPRDRMSVLCATLHLMEAGFRPSETTLTGTNYRRILFRRIEEFMYDMLLDPSFSPTTVATAFGFSPRYLYRLFAEAGTTFSEWVRTERLVRAEKALTCPSFAGQSITQIAHRFGFCDAAHFSNLFKVRYGKPPSAYRALSAERCEELPSEIQAV